jgi:uncharacterized spore protein YtfJ
MKVDEMIHGAQEALAVSRVYGEPIAKNGVTLIPAAEVSGAGGGGSDEANNGGGGFGLSARPVGMWVIRGEEVEWEPAVDATKVAMRGMLVAIVFLFVVRSVVKTLAGR